MLLQSLSLSPKAQRHEDLSLGLELYRNAAIQNLSNLINPGAKIRAAVCCTIWLSKPLEDKETEPKLPKKLTRNVQPLQAGNPCHARRRAEQSRSGTLY
jgi:hypothetical protein